MNRLRGEARAFERAVALYARSCPPASRQWACLFVAPPLPIPIPATVCAGSCGRGLWPGRWPRAKCALRIEVTDLESTARRRTVD